METGMCYLVPKEQMERIMAQLDRIEAQTRQRPDPPPVIDNLLSAAAVAERFKVKRSTVYQWAKVGRLPYFKIGGKVLFKESELEAAVERGEI